MKVAKVILKHGFALWVVAVNISTCNKTLANVTAKLIVDVNAALACVVLNPANRVVTKNCWRVEGLFLSRIRSLQLFAGTGHYGFPTGTGVARESPSLCKPSQTFATGVVVCDFVYR